MTIRYEVDIFPAVGENIRGGLSIACNDIDAAAAAMAALEEWDKLAGNIVGYDRHAPRSFTINVRKAPLSVESAREIEANA